MLVSASTIAAVKLATDLPSLVQEYGVELRRIAGGYIAKCCFHDEKTASLRIHTAGDRANMFKCFGCSAGGDVFNFVMKIEGIPFNAALEKLATYAGIPLDSKLVPRAVVQAAKEDAVMSVWWWGEKKNLVLDWFYAELWEPQSTPIEEVPVDIRMSSLLGYNLHLDELRPQPSPDEEFLDCGGRLLRWIDSMKAPERLQYFLCHVTADERARYRSHVAAEKEFTGAWMSLAGSMV